MKKEQCLATKAIRITSTKVSHDDNCRSFLLHSLLASDGQHLYIHPVNTKCLAKVAFALVSYNPSHDSLFQGVRWLDWMSAHGNG